MNPVVSNNPSQGSSPVQVARSADLRTRGGRAATEAAAPAAENDTKPTSAIVQINPAARERAQAERGPVAASAASAPQSAANLDAPSAAGGARPTGGQPVADTASRVPANVSAALRAYGANQVNQVYGTSAAPESQRTSLARNQDAGTQRSRTDANDPTGLTNASRTKPTRASEQETEAVAEQDQLRQQRNEAANLQSAASNVARLGNQAARTG